MTTLSTSNSRSHAFETSANAKKRRAPPDLLPDLALAEKVREKRFAAIVRFVRRCQASGSAKNMVEQIRRDIQLCQLLVDYETESEIIGMTVFVRDLKKKPSLRSRTGQYLKAVTQLEGSKGSPIR